MLQPDTRVRGRRMWRRIQQWIGWLGDYQAVAAVFQSELVRTYVLPWLFAALTGGAGVLGQVPAMWILMASGVSFAAVATGILRLSEYRERNSPLNKLRYPSADARRLPARLRPRPAADA
jgi:hypothetical protein